MITIRTATITDIPSIQEIAKITWQPTYLHIIGQAQIDYMLNLMYSNQSLIEQFNTHHQFFIAEEDNYAIGYASVSKQHEAIFKLNKLYVLPNYQKFGVGKLLLNEVITFVKKNDGKEIQLQVNRQNNAAQFYKKNGFTILYEKDFLIGDGYYMNDYVMQLAL